MFRIYLLTFEGYLNVHFQNYSEKMAKKKASIPLLYFASIVFLPWCISLSMLFDSDLF
jgi:hypothetical protein